ncbi:hypothetical protein CYMTET_29848 [Cymbomonas tetramitiformis]|uniref:Uncharacterized protein n=1 Tax=Cymbomonas tetramitiformis TaxID=36881 RepID=A0AAE0FK05_9CHLO|nr:hypothetical protein CYMTET_29848 [Cymbomonas tetramitiformis]
MGEWSVWCVVKHYTHKAWDTYGGDWVTKTHERLEKLEKIVAENEDLTNRMAAIESQLSDYTGILAELQFVKGRATEMERELAAMRIEKDFYMKQVEQLET